MLALQAFLFGLTVAAAIGPIAVLVMTYGLRFGASAGLRSALGAALADFTYAVAALALGAAALAVLGPHREVFAAVAAGVLVLFGLHMIWGALRAKPEAAKAELAPKPRPLLTTYLLTVVNPLTVLLFLGFAGRVSAAPTPLTFALVAVCLFLGSLTVQVALALGGAGLGRVLAKGPWIRRINLVSGIGIVAFGVWGLATA